MDNEKDESIRKTSLNCAGPRPDSTLQQQDSVCDSPVTLIPPTSRDEYIRWLIVILEKAQSVFAIRSRQPLASLIQEFSRRKTAGLPPFDPDSETSTITEALQNAVEIAKSNNRLTDVFIEHGRALLELADKLAVSADSGLVTKIRELIRDLRLLPTGPLTINSPDTPKAESFQTTKKKRKGRKPDTDKKKDASIAAAWASRSYKTRADLATEFGLPVKEVNRAIDRHRKRVEKK